MLDTKFKHYHDCSARSCHSAKVMYYREEAFNTVPLYIRIGLVARISRFHRDGRGSIPRCGIFVFPFVYLKLHRFLIIVIMSATSFSPSLRFGDFSWICNRATIPLCSALRLGDPECYSRNMEIGSFLLFEPCRDLDIFSCTIFSCCGDRCNCCSAYLNYDILYQIKIYGSWYDSNCNFQLTYITGRKEMVMFFYGYMLCILLEFMLVSNILPYESTLYTVDSKIQDNV